MIKPKVKVIEDDTKRMRQIVELVHPEDNSKFTIIHSYVDGEKIDQYDEAQIRELWQAQLKRRSESATGR